MSNIPKGTILVEVLADGTVRTETGDLSGPNHQSADLFMKTLATLLGGSVTEEKTKHSHAHTHPHVHQHDPLKA